MIVLTLLALREPMECTSTTRSLSADVIRRTFGANFLIGVSTHSLAEARAARDGDADFAVFGPVYKTESKEPYGTPQGAAQLATVARELAPFPIIALGGIDLNNVKACSEAGVSGIAGIGIYRDWEALPDIVKTIRDLFRENAS